MRIKKKPAFVTPYALFQFCRMLFGFMNTPGTFQRVVNDLPQVVRTEDILTYLKEFIFFFPQDPGGTFGRSGNGLKLSRECSRNNAIFQGIASPS